MTDTSKTTDAWTRARRDVGAGEANKILRKYGGFTGDPDSVPASNVAAAIADLERLATDDGDDGNGFASTKAKSLTLDEVAKTAWAKWNSARTSN